MKIKIFTGIGAVCGFVTTLLGGWDAALATLLLFILLIVLVAVRLDLLMGTDYLRDAVCIAFIANEALSIVENAGLMGVPLPEMLRNAIDILGKSAEKK